MSINTFLKNKGIGPSSQYPCKIIYNNTPISGRIICAKEKFIQGRLILFLLLLGDNNKGYSIVKESTESNPDWDAIKQHGVQTNQI